MPPQGRRNRDWSGTTEPLPLTRRQKLHARRPVPRARRYPSGVVAVYVIPARVPRPPVEPWHAEVPPWFEGPEAYKAAMDAAVAKVEPPWHHATRPGEEWAPPTDPATTQLRLGFEGR